LSQTRHLIEHDLDKTELVVYNQIILRKWCEMSDLPAVPLQREDEIANYIRSGWHPLKIARTMAKRGVAVTPEQVMEFAKSLDIEPVPSPLRRFSQSDKITDAWQDMHQLVLAEQERVVYLLRQEKESGPVPATNVYLNQLWRHLKDLAELELKLGISPHEAATSLSDQPRTIQTLREMLEAQTTRTVTMERITVES
jgi:hypothetical protein